MDHLERCLALATDQKTFFRLCALMQANKLADPAVKPFIDSRPETELRRKVEEGMEKIRARDVLADLGHSIFDGFVERLRKEAASQYPLYCMGEFTTPPIITMDGMEQTVYKATICEPPTILQRFRMMTDNEMVAFIRELTTLLFEAGYDLADSWCFGDCSDEGEGCNDDRRDACIRRWLNSPYKGGEIIGLQ